MRERIERRSVPKRLREAVVGVDALADLMGAVAVGMGDRGSKKMRSAASAAARRSLAVACASAAAAGGEGSGSGVGNTGQGRGGGGCGVAEESRCARTPAECRLRRGSGGDGAGDERVGCYGEFGTEAEAASTGGAAEAAEARVAGDDDDGTADELSFLVERLDVDCEKNKSVFMPYIW